MLTNKYMFIEHTLLVTETGVEVLTARLPTSPGGPVPVSKPTTQTEPPKEDGPKEGVAGEQQVQTDERGSGAVLAS